MFLINSSVMLNTIHIAKELEGAARVRHSANRWCSGARLAGRAKSHAQQPRR